jgi:tetratricopeptide (TPR) repeat protein
MQETNQLSASLDPSRREWSSVLPPDSLKALPRMLSADEQRYLIWLTQARYEGWGAVVDLGCWLGSSSACLAEGLARSGKQGLVHSFDLFRWDSSYMERDSDLRLADGEDFMPEFLRLTQAWKARIRAQQVDLFNYQWNDGPIEILFVDAAKTWGLTNAILRSFGPHVVPGRTRVVVQDYRYPQTMWLPLLTGSRPDLWTEVENTADGSTSTWVTNRPLHGPGGIVGDYGPESFDFASALRILEERQRIDPAGRNLYPQTLLRAALMYGEDTDVTLARAKLEALECPLHERTPAWILEDIASDLVPLAWQAFGAGDSSRAVTIAQRCLRSRCPAPFALGPLGLGLSRLGRHDEAEATLRQMLEQLPNRSEPLIYLADVKSARGASRDALQLLEQALASLPEDSGDCDYVFALLERIAAQPGGAHSALQVAQSAKPKMLADPNVRVRLERLRARV